MVIDWTQLDLPSMGNCQLVWVTECSCWVKLHHAFKKKWPVSLSENFVLIG